MQEAPPPSSDSRLRKRISARPSSRLGRSEEDDDEDADDEEDNEEEEDEKEEDEEKDGAEGGRLI